MSIWFKDIICFRNHYWLEPIPPDSASLPLLGGIQFVASSKGVDLLRKWKKLKTTFCVDTFFFFTKWSSMLTRHRIWIKFYIYKALCHVFCVQYEYIYVFIFTDLKPGKWGTWWFRNCFIMKLDKYNRDYYERPHIERTEE